MVKQAINATIFYKHDTREVAALAAAVIPLADSIRAVTTSSERSKMRTILAGEYFRLRDAERMRSLLLRATRYTRAHLDEYFEMMRTQVMRDTTELERAVDWYWAELREMVDEVLPQR